MPYENRQVDVKLKLLALWSSVMFLYIYGDYFQLYRPGQLTQMSSGETPFGHVSQSILLGMSAIMIIPALMPVLSLVLPPAPSRWANIVFGAVYTVIMALAVRGEWHFYLLYGASGDGPDYPRGLPCMDLAETRSAPVATRESLL